MNALIGKNNSKNFIHFQDARNKYVNPDKRYTIKYPSFCFKKKISIVEKILLHSMIFLSLNKNKKGIDFLKKESITLKKGSQWFSFNSDTVVEILSYLERKPIYHEVFEKVFVQMKCFSKH